MAIEAGQHTTEVKVEGTDITVDFAQMLSRKPKQRELRRIFEDGLWAVYRQSASQLQLHVKLQKLQLDNPNNLSQYPTIFAPVPLPEQMIAKPLVEASLIIRQLPGSTQKQYKLIELLVQEMDASVDQGFINAMITLFQPENPNAFLERERMLELYKKNDEPEIEKSLEATVHRALEETSRFSFDRFVAHPLKVHVSYSMSGEESE